MNDNTDTNLERRLAYLDRRATAQRSGHHPGRRPPGRPGRAQRTKLVTAGASVTAIAGLMAMYGLSSASTSDASSSPSADTVPGDLVVVVDSAGNVISAPDSVSPEVIEEAVAAWRTESPLSTTSLAPVAETTVVDLAVPAVESATAAESLDDSTDTTQPATTQPATTQAPTTTQAPATATAPAAPQRQAPQGRSSGS